MAIRVRRRRRFHLLTSRLVSRLAYSLLIVGLIEWYLLHLSYSKAFADKYSPTTFLNLTRQQEDVLSSNRWHMYEQDQADSRTGLLEHQAHWKKLGSGYEGDTFTFNGSVIKVYKSGRSPLRNCVPGSVPHLLWPSEIPISLILGGSQGSQSTAETDTDRPSFLAVHDYFLLPSANEHLAGQWHLVTPLLSQGTLKQVAQRLREQVPAPTVEQIDAHFRPSLVHVLGSLDDMHSKYGLCHDDIKMDNIFVKDLTPMPSTGELKIANQTEHGSRDAHWLLGDLGNARQISHSYHTSLLWIYDNGQHPDCRINDVLRLMRTYVMFLQSASATSETKLRAFNEDFLAGSTRWSQLYWHTISSAVALDGFTAAQNVRKLATAEFAPMKDDSVLEVQHRKLKVQNLRRPGIELPWFQRWLGIGDSSTKAMAVRRETMTGMRVSEKWAKIFGTMGILKTPSRGC